jgi:glycosyltransferase involved in cell wall biosynthesis
MSSVIIIGPGHPLRGGLATFNHRLAKEFISQGNSCIIYSFSRQYPSLLFPGKSQFTDEPGPAGITIHPVIDSINPFNWIQVGNRLGKIKADIVVVRFWLPFMGPALGTILRKIKKNNHSRIICIADNVIPHEKRLGDRAFTRYFLKSCDGFITMSEKVLNDLRLFQPTKPAKLVHHPLYDNFGESVSRSEARLRLALPENEKIILFFGFIRKYKGLDLLLRAMESLTDTRLLIAGECYEDEKPYRDLIKELNITDRVIWRSDFIPDSEVKFYLGAADAVVQPYRNATQSGVTPLAYHFEKPMIVTNVGGLPALVPDGKAGIVVEPEPAAIADGIRRFYQLGENYFIPHLRNEKQKFSWASLVNAIQELSKPV